MLVQTENDGLVRDTNSRALSPKREALEEFRRNRRKEKRLEELEAKVESMEHKLDLILSLLGNNK